MQLQVIMDASFEYRFESSNGGFTSLLFTHSLRRLVIETFDESKCLQMRERYLDGYLHGEQEEFDRGQLVQSTSYHMGLLSGKMEAFGITGQSHTVKWFWNDRECTEEDYKSMLENSSINHLNVLPTETSEEKEKIPMFPIIYPIKTFDDRVYEKYIFHDRARLELHYFYLGQRALPWMTHNYAFGRLDGPYEAHFTDGRLREKGGFCKGLQHGKREVYDNKKTLFHTPKITWWWLGKQVSAQQFKANEDREKHILDQLNNTDNGFERLHKHGPSRGPRG